MIFIGKRPRRAIRPYLPGLLILLLGSIGGVYIWQQHSRASLEPGGEGLQTAQGPITPSLQASRNGDEPKLRTLPLPQRAGEEISRLRFVRSEAGQSIGVRGFEIDVIAQQYGEVSRRYIADDQGYVRLLEEYGRSYRISIASPAWRYRAGTDSEVIYLDPQLKDLMIFEVEEVRVKLFELRYADGQPYAGIVTLLGSRAAQCVCRVNAKGEFSRVFAAGSKWTLHALSRRPGFADVEVVVNADEVKMEVVLPKTESDFGCLEVECVSSERIEAVTIEVQQLGADASSPQNSDMTKNWPVDSVYLTHLLKPGSYVVSARSDARRSPPHIQAARDVVEICARRSTRVVLRLTNTGAAKIIVRNSKGESICKARLALGNARYVNWNWILRNPPGFSQGEPDAFALSNEEGMATLSGLAPGRYSFVCDAEGYGVEELEAWIAPGENHDLGEITLSEAAGVIAIDVVHDEVGEDAEYEILLLKPLGGIVGGPYKFKGKHFEISRLSLLSYTVSIRYLGGGYGAWSQQADLSIAKATAKVKFVMQKPPLTKD